jgi:metallo-beta-lactamase family protein
MQIEFYSWGAAQEVTGSKHFIKVRDSVIMIDCGAYQGKRETADRKNRDWPFDPSEIDATILTHAHFDHSGLLPLLVKKGFTGNIYATPATRDLTGLILADSAHIQQSDIAFLKKHMREGMVIQEPLYTVDDVAEAMSAIMSVSYRRKFQVTPEISATFYDAGHILGSALVVLDIGVNGQKTSVGFSGDLGRKKLPILRDPDIIPPVDYLFMESTYGNRLHDSIQSASEKLAEIVTTTSARGGKVIIPAFAIERTQELIYMLHILQDQGKIPKIPIFVDSPMATNATSIFSVHSECYDQETREAFTVHNKNPFGFNELHFTRDVSQSKQLNSMAMPAIIISSSGMCEAGRILHHLKNTVEDPRNTILVVGYMAENTLGRRIVERNRFVKIFGENYKLKADVKILNAFSAHADYREIIEYISQLEKGKLKRVFLVHGEPEAQENLKNLLLEKNHKVTIMEAGKRYLENIG